MTTRRLTGATLAPPMREQFGFDPTHGFDLGGLLALTPPDEPDDLDAFWSGIVDEAASLDPDAQVGPWNPLDGHPAIEVADVRFRSLDGISIGGWITRPIGGASRTIVVGHGYGGRDAPDVADVPADAVAIFPVARGLPTRSHVAGVGHDTGVDHVLWGIRSPREYSHVGSVVDMWIAGRILMRILPGEGKPVYMGGSFGGGIGALAVAFGDDFAAAVLEVPSFGDHPLRATLPSTGSSSRVNQHLSTHPDDLRTLHYADAATAATRVRVPTLVLPALADPAVPIPGQFAIANALGGPTWVHVLPHGHCAGEDGCDDSGRAEAIAEFLTVCSNPTPVAIQS